MASQKTRTVVFFNTLSQLIGRATSAITTFIISLILARNLGTQGFGDFSKVTTYIAFFYLLTDLGLNAAFLKHQEENTNVTFQHFLGLRLVISIVPGFLAISFLALL